MIEDEVLELLHTRLITLELIVSEMHENLIDKGLIDKDEFNKLQELKKYFLFEFNPRAITISSNKGSAR